MQDLPTPLELAARIARAFNPERILLFGSRARGDAKGDSDFDLCVVMDTAAQPMSRAAPILGLFHPRTWSLDVVVYTPAETERLAQSRSSLWSTILRQGKVVHERAH